MEPGDRAMDEQSVVRQALGGDKEAFGLLVSRYARPVYSLMLRTVRSPDLAEDLAQEAFLKAFGNLDRFHLGKPFFPWLCTIAMNLARDHLRSQARSPLEGYELDEAAGRIPNLLEQQEDLARSLDGRQALRALQDLPLDYREALVLRFRQDLSMKEIGQALGVTVSGAKMRVQRGLAMLRQRLAQGDQP